VTVPREIFDFVTHDTAWCLCMGVSICEPLCLELYTTEALITAEREADRLLSRQAVERLRTKIVERKLLGTQSSEALQRLDAFLGRFRNERDPLRSTLRRQLDRMPGNSQRASWVWSTQGQKLIEDLLESYEDDKTFVRGALRAILLPAHSRKGEREFHHVVSLPIALSVADFVDSRFQPTAKTCLRRGICLRIEIEYETSSTTTQLGLNFEGPASEDLRHVAKAAFDLAVQEQDEPEGRLIVRTPAAFDYVPLQGDSAGLALYHGFQYALAGHEYPLGMLVTGAIDGSSARVQPVNGIEEKAEAARDAGISQVFYPSADRLEGPSPTVESVGVMPINDRLPQEFTRAAERQRTPKHVRVASRTKIVLFLGLCGAWLALLPFWNLLYVSPDAVDFWFKSNVSSETLAMILRLGIGVAIQLLLLAAPFLLLAFVFILLARVLECATNWIKYGRWEPGLSPADANASAMRARQYTIGQRVVRMCFKFFLVWCFWFLGMAWLILMGKLTKSVPNPPHGQGLLRWIAQIGMVVGGLGLILGVPAIFFVVYRRFRKFVVRLLPYLK